MKQLDSRSAAIANETKNLEALPSKEQKALETAMKEGTTAVVKYQHEESKSTTSIVGYVKKSSFSGGVGFLTPNQSRF